MEREWFITNEGEEDVVAITLTYDNGEEEEIEFYAVAGMPYKGKFYEFMVPVEAGAVEGVGEDEALIFESEIDPEDPEQCYYTLVTDEALYDAVFAVYEEKSQEE